MIRTKTMSMASLKATCLSLLLLAFATVAVAGDYLVYVDDGGVILQGHDPVAMFTDGALTKGDATYTSVYQDAEYRFASAANKKLFDADPARYAPQFGGHCAMSMAMGMLEPADAATWSIVDGRLVVQRNEKAAKMWTMNPKGNLEKADSHWPRLLADSGKKG